MSQTELGGTARRAIVAVSPGVPRTARTPFLFQLKGPIEWSAALVASVALAPIMVAIAVAVTLSGPGPVFYRRRVLGRGGVVFEAFKFRTMVADADAVLERDLALKERFTERFKLRDDPRVTRPGRFLRRYSLDELPQLINVLRGQMALIGPRMISPDEVVKYGRHGDSLLSVKPGLTGLWQTSGRQTTSYEERVALDMSYIADWSFWLDLKIAVRTVRVVLKADGAF
jgi:lipopolysaccharide/colanic/teichoic acid biosynthesis glycosyltransferase